MSGKFEMISDRSDVGDKIGLGLPVLLLLFMLWRLLRRWTRLSTDAIECCYDVIRSTSTERPILKKAITFVRKFFIVVPTTAVCDY